MNLTDLRLNKIKSDMESLVIGQFGTGFVTDEMLSDNGVKLQLAEQTKYTILITDPPAPMVGAKFDGLTDDTTAIQNIIDTVPIGTTILLPALKCLVTSISIKRPIHLIGTYKSGSIFGTQNVGGTIIKSISQTQDVIQIDSSLLLNQGLAVSMENILVIGNADVVGAISGVGINLIGDKTGETFYVSDCYFKDVHVRNTKGDGWKITGTCFENEWYSCSSYGCNGNGLIHDKGSGNPINNNFYNCKFFNSGNKGFHTDGGKCTLYGCNISQNAGGGLYQNSGYLILNDCDFEENAGVQIEVHNSSPSTRITGGMIHKSPGHASTTGISLDNLCLGVNVIDVLFANYDNINDRLFTSTGGSFEKFEVRQQNCLASALPIASYQYIADKNFKRKIQTGNILFTGTGIGIRTETITFPVAFEESYIIVLTTDGNGIDPSKIDVSVDYSTQNYTSITAKINVSDAGYSGINVKYIAIGV